MANNDSVDNWREATQEEYYVWQRTMNEKAEQKFNDNMHHIKTNGN